MRDFDANYSLLSPFICQAVGTKEEKRIDKTRTKSQQAASAGSGRETAAAAVILSGGDSKMDVTGDGAGGTQSLANGSCFAVTKHSTQVKSVTLQGHQGEVFICLWNPVTQQLASG